MGEMRKRSGSKPPTRSGRPYSVKLGRHVGPPELMKGQDEQIIDAANEAKVLRLVLQGHTEAAIAREINRDPRTVSRIKARVNEEYRTTRADQIEAFVATQMARYNAINRTASVRAFGGTLVEKDPRTGRETERKVEPDPKWMEIYLKTQRQIDHLLAGRQAVKIEHIGAGGGPIQVKVNPLEVVRSMRERFGTTVVRDITVPAMAPANESVEMNDDDGSTQH